MKRSLSWAFLVVLLLLGPAAQGADEGKGMKTFKNPILSGFHPDPSICRVGDDFYLVNSTFEYFPGLPIYHSRDLVHWEQIGNALDRPSQLPLQGATDTGGLYAPTIRHHQGTFYLTCTNVSGRGNFIVKAKDPAGPWSEPIWMDITDIDGSMFFDDDGKAYFTNQGGGEKAGIKQCEFDPETCQSKTPSRAIYNNLNEVWNEGPHLYKIKGLYYLMLAEGGTGDRHQEVIGRSKSPWGPFEPCPYNPILTERDRPQSPIQCTGHADLIEAPDGSWWVVFLGTRPQKGFSVLGRETFLAPVSWTKDGWPVVNGDHHVALEMTAPQLPTFKAQKPSPRYEFDGEKLGFEWLYVRNPDQGNFSLSARKGFLRIKAASETIFRKSEVPAFVGVRQPSFRLSARTYLEFSPTQEGEEAGICVRANDDNHYEVAVVRTKDGQEVVVRNTVKSSGYLLARQALKSGKVHLEISASEDRYQFAWSLDGKTWKTLGASPAIDLSREKAGGFTGTVLGLYATSNGKPSQAHADFGWFEVAEGKVPALADLLLRPTPTPQPTSPVWRIRAGGGAWKDSTGKTWGDDQGYTDGDTVSTGRPIQAAKDAELYRTERWGSRFGYAFPVPEGTYRVRLFFAETYVKKKGERVFDVFINGKKVLADLDILKETGAVDKGLEKVIEGVASLEGKIDIQFLARVQNAKICAIEIVPQDQPKK